MFNELGWSTIANRHNYNKAVLTFKALNDLTPEYISNLLKPTFETHNRNLRIATNGPLSVPRSKTSLFDRSFSATAPKLWNSLPKGIITASSLDNVGSPPRRAQTDSIFTLDVRCKCFALYPYIFYMYELKFPVLYAHSYLFEIGLKFY